MVLTSTVVICDNTDWSNNGDWKPTRIESQLDCIRCLAQKVIQDNIESMIGIVSLADPRVLITPTGDVSKFAQATYDVTIEGEPDILRSLQVAQLVLRHRANRNSKQRIILFVGSPLSYDEAKVLKAGTQLRKNGISLDICLLSDNDRNEEILKKLINAVRVDGGEYCAYSEFVPQDGGSFLNDDFRRSAVYNGGEELQPRADGAEDILAGVDPDLDPDLYMALMMSLEDERERQRRTTEGEAANEAA